MASNDVTDNGGVLPPTELPWGGVLDDDDDDEDVAFGVNG